MGLNGDGGTAASACLWVVGTPIGNLGDMSTRGVEVLRRVHAIAAEDTRHARALLTHLRIPRPPRFISYREENRARAAEEIVSMLRAGEEVALVTDAGMPAVSDPGDHVVLRCHEEGLRVSPVPGATSVIAALACSGLPSRRFTFEGFISRRPSHRRAHLAELVQERRTMIFLEAPGRVSETLRALCDAFGRDRRCCVARELTKKFEEIRLSSLSDALTWSESREMRGEFTLVVEGAHRPEVPAESPGDDTLREAIGEAMEEGKTRRQAAKEVAARFGLNARELYKL